MTVRGIDFHAEAAEYLKSWASGLREQLDALDFDERTDEARDELMNSVLSVERLTRNYHDEIDTWEILICTGGPAARILVTTDWQGRPEMSEWQYQDWFEPWYAPPQDGDMGRLIGDFADLFYLEGD